MIEGIAALTDLPTSQTNNPYWDIVRAFPGSEFDWKYDHVWSPDWSTAYMNDRNTPTRNDLCGKYAWSIPDPESLAFVAEHLNPCAIEIGAGTGYWAWQLSQLGVDIIAFDQKPPQLTTDNHWHSPRDGSYGRLTSQIRTVFFDVQEGIPEVLEAYTDRVLFLCWPPMSDMARGCLEHYQGKRLVYIGESNGGCTASDEFFEKVDQEWEEVATHRPIQWWGIHDWVGVYERKPRKEQP